MNLVIKIGTAALSREDGTPDPVLLGNLAAEIASLKREGAHVVLVSSGAMGTGRTILAAQGRALRHCDQVAERQILAALGQPRLMTLYQDLLAPHGIIPAQILLTKQDFRTRDHHKNIAHLFAMLHGQPHILPVVNENDSVAITELMFTDNDELAGLLAAMLNADRLIILSNIAGVYDCPPDEPGAAVIPVIDWQEKKSAVTVGKSKTGRGGMASKLGIAKKMAMLGIRTHIASAREPEIIGRIMRDERAGTVSLPLSGKRGAVKRWLGSEAHMTQASVTANICLAAMLRDEEKVFSVLPVGLSAIDGDFDKGDLVRIVDENKKLLALGVARYGSSKLRPVLEKKQQPVFVHYDHLHRTEG